MTTAKTIGATTTFEADDFRNAIPRFAADAREANQAVVDLLARIAGRLGAAPAQVALAWLPMGPPFHRIRRPEYGPVVSTGVVGRVRYVTGQCISANSSPST